MKLNIMLIALSFLVVPCTGQENENSFGAETMEMLMPPSTAPSMSPAPTAPTSSPTDSPVPSPSPSMTPTGTPTGTPNPTGKPSNSPTDSPVPSPSPSELPTAAPSSTPSSAPSSEPSSTPTSTPSALPSAIPSAVPSASPSSSPSAAPTVSAQPSAAPSVSAMPSSLPSISPSGEPSVEPSISPSMMPSQESATMSALVSITLQEFLNGLDENTQAIFEEQAREFIQNELPPEEEIGVRVNISSVRVLEQTIVPPSGVNSTRHRRFLEEGGLRIRMSVTGEVTPGRPPDDFDFAKVVSMGFAKNYLVFLYRLSSATFFFSSLLGDEARSTSNASGDKEGGATAGIVIGCIAAVALAVAIAFYAYRLRDNRGGFRRPRSINTSGTGDGFDLEQSDSRSSCMTAYDQADPSVMSPASPNKLESGRVLGISRKDSSEKMLSRPETPGSIQSERILGIRAPNTSPAQSDEKNDAKDSAVAGSDKKHVALAAGNESSTFRPPALERDSNSMDAESSCPTYVALANAKRASYCGAMDCRAVDSAPMDCGLLGARPMGTSEEIQYRERKSEDAPPRVKRSGLYDVFAPPGPLGIVVDTTKDGPVIHSLKGTSPLLGLVGSGDLVVGLDEIDTRSMTAATLTRLMAKRAHQSERKVTLLAVNTN